MTPQTEIVLTQIIKTDESIDRKNAIRAMALLRQSKFVSEPAPILGFKTVMRLLSVSKPTLYRYFDQGKLKRIYGEGEHAIGVDQDSYITFTNLSKKGSVVHEC